MISDELPPDDQLSTPNNVNFEENEGDLTTEDDNEEYGTDDLEYGEQDLTASDNHQEYLMFQEEINQLSTNLSMVQAERDHFQRMVQEKDQELKQKEEEKRKIKQDLIRRAEEHEQFKIEQETLVKSLQTELSETRRSLTEELQEKDNLIDGLKTQHAEEQERSRMEQETLVKSLQTELSETRRSLTEELQEKDNLIDGLKTQHAEEQERSRMEQETLVKSLQTELSETRRSLTEELQEKDNLIDGLKTQHAEELQTTLTQLKAAEQECSTLSTSLSQLENACATHASDSQSHTLIISKLIRSVSHHSKKEAEWNLALSKAQQEIAQLQQSHDTQLKELQTRYQQVCEAKAECERRERQTVSELIDRIQKVAELEELMSDVALHQSQLAAQHHSRKDKQPRKGLNRTRSEVISRPVSVSQVKEDKNTNLETTTPNGLSRKNSSVNIIDSSPSSN